MTEMGRGLSQRPSGYWSDIEPVLTEREWTEWWVVNPATGGVVITFDRQCDAEVWLERNYKRPAFQGVVLRSVERRSRCETWTREPETVPWIPRCSWIAEGDGEGNQIGLAWCHVHDHNEDQPVPGDWSYTPAQVSAPARTSS